MNALWEEIGFGDPSSEGNQLDLAYKGATNIPRPVMV